MPNPNRAAEAALSHERLTQLLHYDPETGVFRWRKSRGGYRAGSVAGCKTQGRIVIRVDRRSYLAHRLAFLYMVGAWPPEDVDHINGIGEDNRWVNLRAANNSQNSANRKSANPSGLKGASWNKSKRKWEAHITKNYKRHYLGLFPTPEEAHMAYCEAADRLHGEFARHD